MPRQLDKRIKGCTNPTCECKFNKTKYAFNDEFCVKCGSSLVYVCSNCLQPFESNSPTERFCLNCQAVIDERREKRQEVVVRARKVAGKAALALPVLVKKGPGALRNAAKIVNNDRAREVLKMAADKVAVVSKVINK